MYGRKRRGFSFPEIFVCLFITPFICMMLFALDRTSPKSKPEGIPPAEHGSMTFRSPESAKTVATFDTGDALSSKKRDKYEPSKVGEPVMLYSSRPGSAERIAGVLKTEIRERADGVSTALRTGHNIHVDYKRVSGLSDFDLAALYDRAEHTSLVMAKASRETSEEFKTPGDLEKDLSAAKKAAETLNMEDVAGKLAKMKSPSEIRAFLKRLEQEIDDAERFAEEISSEGRAEDESK